MDMLDIVKLKRLIVSTDTDELNVHLSNIKNRLMDLPRPSLLDVWRDDLINSITMYLDDVSNGNYNSARANKMLATILTEICTGYNKHNKRAHIKYETFNVTELLASCFMFNTRYNVLSEDSIKAYAFYSPYEQELNNITDFLRVSLNRTLKPDDMIKRKLMSADICEAITNTKDKLNDCLLELTVRYNATVDIGDICVTNKTIVELTLPSTGKSFTGIGEDTLSALLFMLDEYSLYIKQCI